MTKNFIINISNISAVISYHYSAEIERYFDYFKTIGIITDLAIAIFQDNENRIEDLIPAEFDIMIKNEARRLLKIKFAIQIP